MLDQQWKIALDKIRWKINGSELYEFVRLNHLKNLFIIYLASDEAKFFEKRIDQVHLQHIVDEVAQSIVT